MINAIKIKPEIIAKPENANKKSEFFKNHGVKVVVDGKNCLPKEEFIKSGIVYKGIGR